MNSAIVQSPTGVTLAGGGGFSLKLLEFAQLLAPRVVAADGGADRLLQLGVDPEAVIGDFDSIKPDTIARLQGKLFPIREQVTTDFDKALRSIVSPFVIGIGFSGARLDHGLAVLNTLVRYPEKRCFILGGRDVVFLAPRRMQIALKPGSRFSLFPMGAVTGASTGLRWPLQGIDFAPDGMIGTSNEVSAPVVTLEFSAERMLVILPRTAMAAALDAFGLRDVRGG
jgi:thiamine pyrophosphokinase